MNSQLDSAVAFNKSANTFSIQKYNKKITGMA